MATQRISLLLEFRKSKRLLKCSQEDNILNLCENELKPITGDCNVQLVTDVEGYRRTPDDKPYLLQRYSSEWQEFVDVIDVIEIGDK